MHTSWPFPVTCVIGNAGVNYCALSPTVNILTPLQMLLYIAQIKTSIYWDLWICIIAIFFYSILFFAVRSWHMQDGLACPFLISTPLFYAAWITWINLFHIYLWFIISFYILWINPRIASSAMTFFLCIIFFGIVHERSLSRVLSYIFIKSS